MRIVLRLFKLLIKVIPQYLKEPIKKIIYGIYYFLIDFIYPKRPKVDFSSGLNNFGDVLNFYLIHKLTGLRIIEIRSEYYNKKNFLFIGSILQRCNRNSIVWGSGFISKESKCIVKPKIVYSVRGPLTRELLIEQDVECPKIYGDPALLLPLIYKSNLKKKYKIGVIPHYVDKNNTWLKKIKNKTLKIIDIQNQNIEGFIDSVCECEIIISSSLHGIIVSDTYGIPSLWVEFSKNVKGDGFKFRDYYMSVGKSVTSPVRINHESSLEELLDFVCYEKIRFNSKQLLKSFPFPFKKSILIEK